MPITFLKNDVIGSIPEELEGKLEYKTNDDLWESESSFEINDSVWEIGAIIQNVRLNTDNKIEIDLYETAENGFEHILKKISEIVGSVENAVYQILQNPELWEVVFVAEENREEKSVVRSLWRVKKNSTYKEKWISNYIKEKKVKPDEFIKRFSFSILHILDTTEAIAEKEREKKMVKYIWTKRERRIRRKEVFKEFLETSIEETVEYQGDNLFKDTETKINELITQYSQLQELIEKKYTFRIKEVKELWILNWEELQIAENTYREIVNRKNKDGETSKQLYSNFDQNYGKTLMYLEFAILRGYFQNKEFDKFFNFLKFCILKNTEQKISTTKENEFKLWMDDLWSLRLILLSSWLFLDTDAKEIPSINILKKVYGDICLHIFNERIPYILKRIEHLKANERMSLLLMLSSGRMSENFDKQINESMGLSIFYEVFQILLYAIILKGTMEYNEIEWVVTRIIQETLPEGESVKPALVKSFVSWDFQRKMKKLVPYYIPLITKNQ